MAKLSKEERQNIAKHSIFHYGASMTMNDFLGIFGFERKSDEELELLPVSEVRKQLQNENLRKLGIVDGMRKALMEDGKFLIVDGEIVRIALPSENSKYASDYIRAGNRKIARAEKLLSRTFGVANTEKSNAASRKCRTKIIIRKC